mgnify:CR=1 FL=1
MHAPTRSRRARRGASRPTGGHRRTWAGALSITVLVATLAACSGDSGGGSATASSTVAKGKDAATAGAPDTTSCAVAAEAKALVPGQANEGAAAKVGTAIDAASLLKDAETIATGISAAKAGPGALIGWAFKTLSGGTEPSDPDKERLQEISNRLDQISAELQNLEAQMAQMTNLIKDSTYINAVKSLTDDHIAPMLSMWQQYCEVVGSQDTDQATIDKLTDAILDPSTGIRAHVTALVSALKGSPVTGNVPLVGMFSEFVKDQQKLSEFDDRDVYSNSLDPFTQYFANLSVMGLVLMTEAWHAKGDTKEAQATLDDFWTDTRGIYQAGGFPLSDDDVVLQIPSAMVFTRTPVCPKATFASKDFGGHMSDDDAVQATLARNVYLLSNNPPTPAMSYSFAAGDPVCSFAVGTGWPTVLNFEEALINQGAPPTDRVRANGGAGIAAWRLPFKVDLDTLLKNRGSATPQAYLDSVGFTIPAKGTGATPLLATSEITNGFTWFDTNTGALTTACVISGEPNCDGSTAMLSQSLVADAACRLGAGDYPGLPTACGTKWLDQRWPADPPPPAA